MAEQAPREQDTTETEVGSITTRDIDKEFNAIIAEEFQTPNPEDTHIKPFLVGRMVLKEIVIDRHRTEPQPSTNRAVTWTRKDDGSGSKVDSVTYGDTD